jgi:DNA polymerase-3 subunit gamma/tau
MLGNKTNVNMIKKGLDKDNLPHTFLFTGDAGCGKTTAARIIALGLNCRESDGPTSDPCLECTECVTILNQNSMDVVEVNVGQSGGKDAVDTVSRDLMSAPFSGRFKVVIFDEAHKLTPAAQDLLLKVIEDGYKHVYFVFCTNKPEKLTEAFIGRCSVMHFGRISTELISEMLVNVAQFEGMDYDMTIIQHIAEESRGVPRNALVWLRQVEDEGTWTLDAAKAISGILLDETDPQVVEISKSLIQGKFKPAYQIYDKIKRKQQAENVRIAILSYLVGCLKRARSYGDADRFSQAIDIISQPIYQQGKPGDYILYNYLYKVAKTLKK